VSCVFSRLLYAAETWTSKQKIHDNCLLRWDIIEDWWRWAGKTESQTLSFVKSSKTYYSNWHQQEKDSAGIFADWTTTDWWSRLCWGWMASGIRSRGRPARRSSSSSSSSIGACRCRCCSCECPPSCSVLCSPKPWRETKIKLAQIFLHRP